MLVGLENTVWNADFHFEIADSIQGRVVLEDWKTSFSRSAQRTSPFYTVFLRLENTVWDTDFHLERHLERLPHLKMTTVTAL